MKGNSALALCLLVGSLYAAEMNAKDIESVAIDLGSHRLSLTIPVRESEFPPARIPPYIHDEFAAGTSKETRPLLRRYWDFRSGLLNSKGGSIIFDVSVTRLTVGAEVHDDVSFYEWMRQFCEDIARRTGAQVDEFGVRDVAMLGPLWRECTLRDNSETVMYAYRLGGRLVLRLQFELISKRSAYDGWMLDARKVVQEVLSSVKLSPRADADAVRR